MDEKAVVDKVNRVLEEVDHPIEILDISDIENFLNDRKNIKLEVYDEIEQLYNHLIENRDNWEDYTEEG